MGIVLQFRPPAYIFIDDFVKLEVLHYLEVFPTIPADSSSRPGVTINSPAAFYLVEEPLH